MCAHKIDFASIHLYRQHFIQIQWIGIIPSVLKSSTVIRQCLFFLHRVCNIVSKSDLFTPSNKSNIYAINSRPTPTPTKTIFSMISSSYHTYGWISCLSASIYLPIHPLVSIRPPLLQTHIKHVPMVNYFTVAMSLWAEAEALHFKNGIYRQCIIAVYLMSRKMQAYFLRLLRKILRQFQT